MWMNLLTVIIGIFCISASAQNWDWFFNNYRAKPIVKLFGRDGARIFYAILGIFLTITGLFHTF